MCGETGPAFARVAGRGSWSGIRDLLGGRSGRLVASEPNANVLFPHSAFPVLEATLEPGERWLACAVCAMPAMEADREWNEAPAITLRPASRSLLSGLPWRRRHPAARGATTRAEAWLTCKGTARRISLSDPPIVDRS